MAILASTIIDTDYGEFKVCYHKNRKYEVVSFSHGDIENNEPIVRIHSSCLFGEVFGSRLCDCDHQIVTAMKFIKNHGTGVIVYSYQEGRGIGLLNKIKALEVERIEGCDTTEAFRRLKFKRNDYREYEVEVQALLDLKMNKDIYLFSSGNPKKIENIERAGFTIKGFLFPDHEELGERAKNELKTKVEKMGYRYS